MRVFLIKIFLHSCALLPLPLAHGLGFIIGCGLIVFPNQLRTIGKTNIALCWPDLGASAQRQLLRSSLIEAGKTITEVGSLWLRPGNSALRLIKQVEGAEQVRQAIARDSGVILATPHLGAWEGAGLYCAAHFDITCLYRPLKLAGLEQLVSTARNRAGGNYLPATGNAIRTLYKTLQQGRAVAMLPDQEPHTGSGVFAPFFGIPAYSMVLLARLATRSATPVIFVWCERLSWGRGYRLHFRPAPAISNAANLQTAVNATNAAIEDCIRQCPAQYQWGYRRFRTRPAGEAQIY